MLFKNILISGNVAWKSPFFISKADNLAWKEGGGHSKKKARYYMMNFRNFLIKSILEGNKSYNDRGAEI